MESHYQQVVAATEAGYRRMLTQISVDQDNPYHGALDDMRYLIEPGTGTSVVGACCTLYACRDSRYYRDPELLKHIHRACDMLLRAFHADGTMDYLATNYYTPASFELQHFCRGYKLFAREMQGTELEIKARDRMLEAMGHLARGCLNGGFHTPNHRWVEAAALMLSYNILNWPELMAKAEAYLSEGIDCDEHGEFTERSVGVYNPINVNAMMVIAEEANKPELLLHARRCLDLTFFYLDGDGTLFTRNSRRQDRMEERCFPEARWHFLYLWAGEMLDEPRYLRFARDLFERAVSSGRGVPGQLWLYLERPQLQGLAPDLSGVSIPDHYHAFFPESGILRVRKGDFSYSMLCNNPDFLHIKFGNRTVTLRACASFFAVAQVAPPAIERTDAGYRLHFRAHGEYKGLLPKPPASPDWFAMDHASRPVIHPCELDVVLTVTDQENSLTLHVQTAHTPNVPFKLEFVIPSGTRLETDQVILDTAAEGSLAIKKGDMRLEDVETGSQVFVRGLFAQHMYHRDMRGSVPPKQGAYSVYATAFTPVDRVVHIEFAKRLHPRAMAAPV